MLTAVFVALSAGSCNKNGNPDDNGNNGSQLKPGAYKFKASALKGTWEAGDVIYIKGGTGPTAESITIKASDLSDGGKTATLNLGEVTADFLDPDGLYAAWPDEAVQHSFGVLKPKTIFNNCEKPVCVAYLDGNTFSFIDASSALDFTVSGGYDEYAFASAEKDGLIYTGAEVEYSSAKKKITPKNCDGYPFIYGSVKNGAKNRILFTGEVTMKGGYTLFLKKNGVWCATYSSNKDVTLKPGEPLDLGDISGKLSAYDGPEPKMPKMGERTKYTVKFNELSGICLSKDEDFLWGVGDDGSIAKLSFTGEVLYEKWIGCDLEAVSRNPETEDLIVGIEDEYNPSGSGIDTYSYNGVGRILSPNFNKVEGLYRISAANKYNNAGVEGVTYYKDGYILAGTQANSHLFCIKYETGEVLWSEMLYDKDTISEIADLCYDPKTGWLWIMDSENKKFFATVIGDDHKVNILCAYSVSEIANPESVCVDHRHSCIWVGDDYGDTSYLYKYEFTGLDDANIIPSIE